MKLKAFIRLTVIAAMFVIGLCGNSAAMGDDQSANYVFGGFGMFQPADDMDDGDFDAGWSGGLGYGRYLGSNLIVEASLNFSAHDRDETGVNTTAGFYDQDDELEVSAFLVTLKGETSAGVVDLFAGAGFGVYGVTLYSEVDSYRFGDFDESDSDSVVGTHVCAGLNFNINDFIFLGLEGSYRWTGDVELRERVLGVPVEYEGNLNGFNILTRIGFRFL